MELPWHLYLMALLYVIAGINHFRKPRIYLKIIPPYLPKPHLLNTLSGLAEIGLGLLLCVPVTSSFAAIGIIALLIAVFPANLYMYQEDTRFPKWLLFIRLPLQIVLIFWAYEYTNFEPIF